MTQSHACRLTPKDQYILHALLAQRGNNDSLTLLLREKLAAATVVQEHAMPPDVVTLYSRVRYRVDGLAQRVQGPGGGHAAVTVRRPRGHDRGCLDESGRHDLHRPTSAADFS